MELTREQAKAQFDFFTEKLGLIHTFTFDEMYDFMLDRRQKKFRKDIMNFEEKFKQIPGTLGKDPFPLTHTFVNGLYIRYLIVPPQALTVTQIHKWRHVFFILKGTVSVLTEDGVHKFTAPHMGITEPGTKRIIWHHDEVHFITVHAIDETDVESAEKKIFAQDFDEVDKEEDAMLKEFVEAMKEEE